MIGTAAAVLLALGVGPALGTCPEVVQGGGQLKSALNPKYPNVSHTVCDDQPGDICLAATQEYPCCVHIHYNGEWSQCYTRDDFEFAINSEIQAETAGLQCTETLSVSTFNVLPALTSKDCFPPALACPGEFVYPVPGDVQQTVCNFQGHTFDSVDDTVCSAANDGFECCFWQNATTTVQFNSMCYENAHAVFPCGNSLAETVGSNNDIVYSRNCSDHSPASTTTTPGGVGFYGLEENGCSIDGYTTRGFINWRNQTGTVCLHSSLEVTLMPQMDSDTGAPTATADCRVATREFRCCGWDFLGFVCFDMSHEECSSIGADGYYQDPFEWCTPPEPADDSGLSTGAIAGIAVGAVAFVGLIAAAAVCL